jgi:hypothetical protein
MKNICHLIHRNLYNNKFFFAGIKLLRERINSIFINEIELKNDYMNQIDLVVNNRKKLIQKNKLFYKNKISIADIKTLENIIKYDLFKIQVCIDIDLLFIIK